MVYVLPDCLVWIVGCCDVLFASLFVGCCLMALLDWRALILVCLFMFDCFDLSLRVSYVLVVLGFVCLNKLSFWCLFARLVVWFECLFAREGVGG